MKERALANTLGLVVVAANTGLVALLLVLWLVGGFSFDEMTTSVAIIAPMFFAHSSIVIRTILRDRHKTAKGKNVSGPAIAITLSIPSVFVVVLAASIFAWAYGWGLADFEEFKALLVIVESAFGVYLGIVISTYYQFE